MSATMDSEAWDRRYAGSELVWTAEPNRFLVTETEQLPAGRSLDLACGEGRNSVWLAQRGWQATGVDFSAVALEKAAALAQARGVSANWEVADLLTYSPPAGAFDLVILFYLQLPEQPRRRVMRAAAQAVAPGGTLLVVAHHSDNLSEGHGGPQNAEVLYTEQDLRADLEGSGLELQRAERVQRPVATEDGERVALDTLLRARRPQQAG